MSIQRIAIRDLEPNPYRHIDKYQIVEEKVERLIASYGESGFWDGSIQVRPHPTKAGKFQLAFGHHRKEAAKRAGLKELGVVVAARDNATMLRMMASENAEEFKHSPLVAQETVGAVVEAYGAGEIDLEAVHPETPKGTVKVLQPGKTYTLQTVAHFLGWVTRDGMASRNCRIAFDAWHAKQDHGVDVPKYVAQIPPERQTTLAAEAILTSVKAATRAGEKAHLSKPEVSRAVKAAAQEVVDQFTSKKFSRDIEDGARRAGRDSADAVAHQVGKRVETLPTIQVYAKKLIAKCEGSTGRYDDVLKECRRLIPFVDEIDRGLAGKVADALVEMLKRDAEGVRNVAAALRSGRGETFAALLEA